MYFKGENERSSLTCFENTSLVCAPMTGKDFNTCDNFNDLLECYMNIYDRNGCSVEIRSEFCHFLTTDLRRDEVIDASCFRELDQTCESGNDNTLYGTLIFLFTEFGRRFF